MRYSPGPWRMKPNGELWSYSRGGTPGMIGTMYWSGNQDDKPGNAKLISAAADLAESLDEVYLLISQPSVAKAVEADTAIAGKARLILENAKEALEAATGRKVHDWRNLEPAQNRLRQGT